MNLDLATLSYPIDNSRKENIFPLFLPLKLFGDPINTIFLESILLRLEGLKSNL